MGKDKDDQIVLLKKGRFLESNLNFIELPQFFDITKEVEAMKEEQIGVDKSTKEMRETSSIQENIYSFHEKFDIKNTNGDNESYVDQGKSVMILKMIIRKLSINIRSLLWIGHIFGNKIFILE